MLVNDLAIGNTVSGPTGNLVIRGTVQSDQGLLLLVVDPETKLGALIQAGELIENEAWSLEDRVTPNGNALIETVGETDALRSEVERLGKLTDALLQQQQQTAPTETSPPVVEEVPPAELRTGQDA